MPHRLGPKNVPLPQVPAKISSLRNSNSASQESSFDDGLGEWEFKLEIQIMQIICNHPITEFL